MTALGRALSAPPAVVWIEGEAGIGKSRLLREYLATPAGRANRVLMACCPPLRHPHTLGPVVDAVRQAADRVTGLPLSPLAGALRPVFAEWAGDLPPAPGPAEDATAVRHRVFRALAELLGCLRVAVLVVEDAHWADEATLEFLLFLASAVPQPVSLAVTCRPEDVPSGSLLQRLATRLAADSASAAGRLRLTLGPLDVASTGELVSSMLAGEEISAGFAGFVHQRTEGVPLAVEGSVRLMADRADLSFRGGGWERRRLDKIGVPVTVRDMVLERLGRLGPDAQAVLQAAAVLSGPADEATVQAVVGLSAERAGAGLCEALNAGLIDDDGRGLVAFRHVLACQAMYDAVPAPRRRLLHRRAGRALERLTPQPVAELADHFRQADEKSEWCRHGGRAAGLALASGDEATAGALLHDLIVNAGLSAASVVRLIKKFPFASFAGPARYRELELPLRAILDSEVLQPGQEADVRVQLGNVLLLMGEDEAGRAELERAIPHLAHDPAEAARAMMRLGWPRSSSWPVSAHLGWLQRAAELVVPSMSAADRLSFAADQASVRLMLGETDGWAQAARIPDDASVSAERQQITRANLNIGDMAMLWGRYDVARRRLEKALALAERHHYLRYQSAALVTRAHLDWLTGAWDGLSERAAALASPEDILPLARLESLLVTGLLQAAAGAHAQAAERLQRVLGEEVRSGALADSMEPAAALSRLALTLSLGPATASAGTAAHAAPRHGQHAAKVRYACGEPAAGHVRCLALVRTDVHGGLGVRGRAARAAGEGAAAATLPAGYGRPDLRSAYHLPATGGGGQTVALVEAFDDPNAEADLAVYRATYGLPACTTANGCFTKVNQEGQQGNYPQGDSFTGWAVETSLDLDMVSAVCPQCHILLVEGNSTSDADLAAAEGTAASLGATEISNSYGEDESNENLQLKAAYRHPGVAITASTGDSGFTIPSFPAVLRSVIAVGGTSLQRDPGSARGWTETAWDGSGSGCSAWVAKPAWQTGVPDCPGRVTADVAADADPSPDTALAIYDTVPDFGAFEPGWLEAGGTSAASPMIAGVIALAGNPGALPAARRIYHHVGQLNDVTSGSNANNGFDCGGDNLCNAVPGYDGPTGLGTPKGAGAF